MHLTVTCINGPSGVEAGRLTFQMAVALIPPSLAFNDGCDIDSTIS